MRLSRGIQFRHAYLMKTTYNWKLYHDHILLCQGEADTERKAMLHARKAYKVRMAGAGKCAYLIEYHIDAPLYESGRTETHDGKTWREVGISWLSTRKR